jgi:hypothetical protein
MINSFENAADAVFFMQPLHAFDGVALIMQEHAQTLKHLDILPAVESAPPSALHRPNE